MSQVRARTFTLVPRGPFDLRMVNTYFGGWVDTAGGGDLACRWPSRSGVVDVRGGPGAAGNR